MKWLPTLFAAESIPSAVITFVALLMFLQLGVDWAWSTLLCGLLSLPWVLKSFLREKVRFMGRFTHVLSFVEACIFGCLVVLAFTFSSSHHHRITLVFIALLLLCMFCAWHELAARMYYERKLRPWQQRYYNTSKMFFSQASVVVTYGAMIMAVGALEVFYHNRHHAIALSWSTAIYLLAGFYLLLALYNFFVLRSPHVGNRSQAESLKAAVRAEVHVIDRILHKPQWLSVVLSLFFLLLPQALLFHTRVLFLFAPRAEGGLGCSLQWIGLAQGTVGVMAFSFGLGLGHRLLSHASSVGGATPSHRIDVRRSHAPSRRMPYGLWCLPLALVLSPVVYLVMTAFPPTTLPMLCVATLFAQFCFGFGLNACMLFVRYISGERYRSTISYLYIPLVSFVMLPAVGVSGWLVALLGFHHFFLLDVLSAIPALAAAYIGHRIVHASSLPVTHPSPSLSDET